MHEHRDVEMLKFILETAALVKKFVDPSKLNPDQYVDLANMSIVLTKLRNSARLPRGITYHQLKDLGVENVLSLLIKQRDFALATMIVELLRIDKLHVVYEGWCIQMLRYSTQTESALIIKLRDKLENLAAKFALDMGYPIEQVHQTLLKAKQGSPGLLAQIRPKFNFSGLAMLALKLNKPTVARWLIQYEHKVVPIINFMLQARDFKYALHLAVDTFDSNQINKVLLKLFESGKSEA